jgi:hypothetical protein
MKKIKAAKTIQSPKLQQQGKLRWSIELKNGDVMDKYNGDGTKNVYASKENGKVKVYAPIKTAKTIGLTDPEDNVLAVMDVPDGAVAFQRRRVADIPYSFSKVKATKKIGGKLSGNRWIPERTLTKLVPVYEYGQCWLIGWRTPTECRFKVVFEDGRVDEYTEFATKPYTQAHPSWTKEPEWFPDEQV